MEMPYEAALAEDALRDLGEEVASAMPKEAAAGRHERVLGLPFVSTLRLSVFENA
jgi:hypothetical protein